MGSVLLAPTSAGSVQLHTNNVWDDPIIDTAFLSTAYDRYIMETGKLIHTLIIPALRVLKPQLILTAIAQVKRIAKAPALRGFVGAPYGEFANTENTADTLKYIEVSWFIRFDLCLIFAYINGRASELDRPNLAPCWNSSNRQERDFGWCSQPRSYR